MARAKEPRKPKPKNNRMVLTKGDWRKLAAKTRKRGRRT